MTLSDIHLRDPFILPHRPSATYYLYGTTDQDPWKGPGTGFDVHYSADLENWQGPVTVFKPPDGFWADRNFWAPEVHEHGGECYMLASFKAPEVRRATQILRASSPLGPFRVHSPRPLTPAEWECLDGTLYVDGGGRPWLVFCHEWVQARDGEICAQEMADDLTHPIGEPLCLFTAAQAPWVKELIATGRRGFVTDGPFLQRTASGHLLLLWSSFSARGYAMGVAISRSGEIAGPWHHEPNPLVDGGWWARNDLSQFRWGFARDIPEPQRNAA